MPYTYTDKEEATDSEKVNQISVMITDEAYGSENAQILYYGALQNVKNTDGTSSTVAEASTGTGTFALPNSLTGTLGTDYHIYLLAEHVNADNSTDYASEPKEVTTILNEVDTVAVPSIDTPTAEQPLQTEITVSSEGVANTAGLAWIKNGTEVTGNAQWKTTYQSYVTLTAKDGYTFIGATGVIANGTLNGSAVDSNKITLNNDGTQMIIDCGAYTTATRKTTGAEAPEVPTQFANYYTAKDVLSSTELGKAVKVTLEGTTQPNQEEMEVEWSIANEGGATYDATPTATNTFKWTVKASEYANYNKDNAVLEGTVTIKNKDYIPVIITGEDVTVTYDGKNTLDVSQYFTIDENAGTATYELSDTSTGTGTLDGATLTMTTLGTFVVKATIKGVYNKGEHTLTITVNKATPDVEPLPTVDDRTYHPSTTLVDGDLKGGTVKDVDGKPLAGAWNWKEAGVVPTVGNDGYVAVFTPNDKVHYQTIEKTVSVNVTKATLYIKTKPTAAITYGQTLGDSALSGGAVQYSENDETTVAGTFTWKEAAAKPTVSDSGKTAYAVIFKPTDKDNYNTVETRIALTVNKAEVAPNKPGSTMNTVYTNETVGKVTLPEGWVWQNTDKTKALEVGKAVTATAIYNGADKGNYVTESVEVSITRQACTHTWDAGVVTKDATPSEKTYTCTVCKETKTEEVPALGAPKVGTEDTSDDGKATYKVTTASITKGTVTYVAPTNKKKTTVTIPATVTIDGVNYKVTTIGKKAFYQCTKLKTVKIGKNVTTIGSKTFYGCSKLSSVTIGSNVTTISDKAFYKCTSLTKITIPSKVKKIGKQAFYGCKKLKTITIKTTKLNSKNVGSKAFKGIYAKATIKVPKSKLKSYKKLLKARGVGKKAKIKK